MRKNFREEKMNGICIKTPLLYSHILIYFPLFSPHMQLFLNHMAETLTVAPSATLLLFTSISLLPCLLPQCATLSHSISAGVLVSDGVLVDPASGPVVFQCHTSQAEH